nr:tRNA (adenosine(37)-N6)-dimethylallyltransferase MiaA [Desulfobulbaceae bacterium]
MSNLAPHTSNKHCFSEPVIFLAGPTASGKTELAIAIAQQFNCEIVGVDSMQIYKYMDIGSAKPSKDELSQVAHHLIDYVNPDEPYNASRFVSDCCHAIECIRERDKIPLLVGGTGLYFQALEFGIFSQPQIDEAIRENLRNEVLERGSRDLHKELQRVDLQSAERIHENDSYRIVRALEIFRSTGKTWSEYIDEHKSAEGRIKRPKKLLKLGIDRNRDQLYERINQRVATMIELGLVAEVNMLLGMGYAATLSSMQSLGYRHILSFLNGEWSWEKTVELLARDTRRYAKRQFTWFKKDTDVNWYYPDKRNELFTKISKFLAI